MITRLLPAFLATACTLSAASIWVEGEAPAKRSVQRHGWYDGVKRELMSGNDWLSHYGNEPGEASYEFDVREPGKYVAWARLNPVASEVKWRLGDAEWRPVDFKDARQQQNVASDDRIDHRFIAWVKLGEVELAAGKQSISFRFDGKVSNSGGLDCFALTTDPWVPQGTIKPSADSAPAAPDEWFPVLVDEDTFDPRSVIDMSALIPAPAGQFGFLKANGDKLQFEKAKTPVKFWGVGGNAEVGKMSRGQATQRAKYLRKFGVNIVRQHPLFDEVTTNGKIDPKKLDAYDWWFAELKKHGIYSSWSVFYHFTIGPEDGYPKELFDELPRHGGGNRRDTYGLQTVSPQLWEIRNKVLIELLTHKNPYTGLRYVDDPALATVEMQNEDSVFFYNPLQELAKEGGKWPRHASLLKKRFAAWVKKKYRTDEALKTAWGTLKQGDSVNAPELELMGAWELHGPGPRGRFSGQTRRAGDFIQCLAEMQRGFYEDCEKAIRAAGFQGVTITTAWQVGGSASEAANLWTDTVGSMIDRHNYMGGGAGGHGIAEGKVSNESHLRMPGGGIFTAAMKQVEGKPFGMTEWTQLPPNQWKLECAPIFAFYGMGLQGWDASWHFAQSGTRLGDGWPRMTSYASDTPHYIGQFPALAFALHKGHITEAPIVAARRLTMQEVFSGTDALKQDATQGGYDAKTLIVDGGTPLEVFAIGRVTIGFENGKTAQQDFSKWWNPANRVITSATGELVWDYGRERILVRAPKTQAIIGKPGNDTVRLPGAEVKVKTPFVSLIFTALDDRPIADSKRILITALAQDKQTGARYSADGTRLEATGTPPLLLEPVQAEIKLAGAKPATVQPCDHYGVPRGKPVPVNAAGAFTIDGTHRAYYYEVRR